VKFFTAAQIPGIEKRNFPRKLAGRLYKRDIPIFSEEKLPELIKKYKIDDCVFSYSDVSHIDVMHKCSIVLACGANFVLLGGKDTMIKSRKKVIAVCAVRTGSGKSQTTRRIAEILARNGEKVVAIRHPMPYGDLWKQRCQRFESYEDLNKHDCTIEEREEYEPWIKRKMVIYAGVDYRKILRQAEKEADVILWDGGNNDFPFYAPNLHIVVTDPHRPGHELRYHPGEANFRMADVIVINKVETAPKGGIEVIEENIKKYNPKAIVVKAASKLEVSDVELIRGKRALVVEDGPTLTHGGMKYGAGFIAAKRNGGRIVSPKKYAVGSIAETYKKYGHVSRVLPAMGYGKVQIEELNKTINRVPCDVIVSGTPIKLSMLVKTEKPIVNVSYVLKEIGLGLRQVLVQRGFLK
jgi:predicted GTPase